MNNKEKLIKMLHSEDIETIDLAMAMIENEYDINLPVYNFGQDQFKNVPEDLLQAYNYGLGTKIKNLFLHDSFKVYSNSIHIMDPTKFLTLKPNGNT